METVLVEDVLHRFMLERAGVRGVLVRLGAAWREVAGRSAYPAALRSVLGQTLAASALLTGNIKLEGALSVELKSTGPLRLLFAECTDQGRLRGLARWSDPLPETLDLAALPSAIMAITIGHAERGQRYQGLVDLQHPDLASALENYFSQSEQLPARIVLAADGEHAVGLMLQKMPDEGGIDAVQDEDAWTRIQHLTATLGQEELLSTAPEQLLYRLYHEESVRLFEPRPLAFGCSCTRERVETVLRSLGRDEVEAALEAREGEIEVICEFCAQRYTFDRVDAEHLLSASPQASAPTTPQ
ncbi:heat shock protein Hsp33 [Dyella jiangningensis]|uniref:Hsp33 family molecular chaperone HslO n=1 Tax=Dyella jiangningensis TaxID=1379159 RepID=UPI0004567B19|nr:Hsp33 family molecular chaperone HslO [Dyella jiangningensis]AHX12056.1 heat shock protein Hsp33 [Dyella jiangningensis]AHX16002.1 heat shock protein Hsp33 [Dyella jiangningensis]MDG2539404.1 Hsp33 family molecular chaperone HslO [Dyella jiangningensis]